MAGKLVWNGNAAVQQIRAGLVRNLSAAAIVVQNRAKVLLSVPGTGQGRHVTTGRFTRTYGANPSKPGEPPRKQTGRLRASVAHEVDEKTLTARVGTNVVYGRILELGGSKVAARSWLRRALAEVQGQVNTILGRKVI